MSRVRNAGETSDIIRGDALPRQRPGLCVGLCVLCVLQRALFRRIAEFARGIVSSLYENHSLSLAGAFFTSLKHPRLLFLCDSSLISSTVPPGMRARDRCGVQALRRSSSTLQLPSSFEHSTGARLDVGARFYINRRVHLPSVFGYRCGSCFIPFRQVR